MRIIGGQFRGRRLHGFDGTAIRPTGARAREAVFNILGDQVTGKTVLDLFAGTGALGLEALSRGARQAVFVDKAPSALSVIRQNIAACGVGHQSRVLKLDLEKNGKGRLGRRQVFELVFMDPPYRKGLVAKALVLLATERVLQPRATAVVEHDPREEILMTAPGESWQLVDTRKYGVAQISFWAYLAD